MGLPADRAKAAELCAFLIPKLVIARAMATRKAGGLADDQELERRLRALPTDHPSRSRLVHELGLAPAARAAERRRLRRRLDQKS